MKEIDIAKIIKSNFLGKQICNFRIKEYKSLWDAFHSSEYRKVSQRNFGSICEGFKVAEIEFEYLSPKGLMEIGVAFEVHFDFEYAKRVQYSWSFNETYPSGNKFSVKPKLGIDEISIKFPSFMDDKNLEVLNDNIPYGGGNINGKFIHYSTSGMCCEGHPIKYSNVSLEPRIVNYFNYLFGMIDEACYYELHPDKKPRIVNVEQSSYYEDEVYDGLDEYPARYDFL